MLAKGPASTATGTIDMLSEFVSNVLPTSTLDAGLRNSFPAVRTRTPSFFSNRTHYPKHPEMFGCLNLQGRQLLGQTGRMFDWVSAVQLLRRPERKTG